MAFRLKFRSMLDRSMPGPEETDAVFDRIVRRLGSGRGQGLRVAFAAGAILSAAWIAVVLLETPDAEPQEAAPPTRIMLNVVDDPERKAMEIVIRTREED